MSEKPLIIKSTFYNIKPEELEKIRKIIKKQMEEAVPVVMLPCGFELAEVNVEMLESLKAKIITEIEEEYIPCTGGYTKRTLNAEKVINIIDEAIKGLKGENK